MQYVADWICPDTGVIVVIAPPVLDKFASYVQGKNKYEAGGILLGYRRGDHFEVIHATEPSEIDKRSRFHFVREAKYHSEIASKLWAKSNGTINYIGEWHTHPEETPTPSSLDINEWKKLTMKSSDQNPFVMTIVGAKELWTGLSHPNGLIKKLIEVT